MKKIKVLMYAFVLTGMTIFSCSSDDDSGPAPTIDGKWNQTKTVVEVGGQSFTQNYNANVVGCNKNYIEFAPFNVFNEVVYFKAAGTGDCQTNMAAPGTWTKNDQNLTMNNSGVLSGTYQITRLSGNNLDISTTSSAGGVTTKTTIFMTKAN